MTEQKATKRKGGRPPKHPGEGKRPTLTVRVRPSTHARLLDSATKNGRSLSEEVEQCVEHYYDNADAYGELARLIGAVVRALEAAEGKSWMANWEMRVKTRAAIDAVLDILVTKGQDPVVRQREAVEEIEKAKRYDPTQENKLLVGSKPDFSLIRRKLDEVDWITSTQLHSADVLQHELYKTPMPEDLPESDPRKEFSKYLHREGDPYEDAQ